MSCELSFDRDGGAELHSIRIAKDAVLEIETDYGDWVLSRSQFLAMTRLDENGFSLDQLLDIRRNQREVDVKPQLPTTVKVDGDTRGFVRWILKALQVLHIDAVKFAVSKISQKIDRNLSNKLGSCLYQVDRDGRLRSRSLSAGDDPVLLVHGTACASLQAFRELLPSSEVQRADWQRIREAY